MSRHVPDVLAAAQLGPVTLRHRTIKSATFEHMSPGAVVSDALIEFHRRVAGGGVGMIDLLPASKDGQLQRLSCLRGEP